MDAELLTHVFAIAAGFGVGASILRKALRAGDRLAALLAASLLIDGVEWAFWAGHLYWPTSDPAVSDGFATACRLGISAAVLCMGFFTRLTFRPDSLVAGICLWAAVGAMGIGFVGSGMVGDWRGFRSDHPWIWMEVLSQILVYAWACVESVLYYDKLRRRVPLGLADPLLANKFLLWGLYAAGYFVSHTSFLVQLASPAGFTTLDPVSIVSVLVSAGALWLAFFPPAAYQAWIRSAASSAGAGSCGDGTCGDVVEK